MRTRSAIAALLAASVSACAHPPAVPRPDGEITALPAGVNAQSLADDAARQLQALYPAASTRLALRQNTDSGFGSSLAAALRTAGYALQESSSEPPGSAGKEGKGTDADPATQAAPIAEVPIAFVLDRTGQADMYFLALNAGRQRLSRAYVLQQQSLRPAGAWVRGALP